MEPGAAGCRENRSYPSAAQGLLMWSYEVSLHMALPLKVVSTQFLYKMFYTVNEHGIFTQIFYKMFLFICHTRYFYTMIVQGVFAQWL